MQDLQGHADIIPCMSVELMSMERPQKQRSSSSFFSFSSDSKPFRFKKNNLDPSQQSIPYHSDPNLQCLHGFQNSESQVSEHFTFKH